MHRYSVFHAERATWKPGFVGNQLYAVVSHYNLVRRKWSSISSCCSNSEVAIILAAFCKNVPPTLRCQSRFSGMFLSIGLFIPIGSIT